MVVIEPNFIRTCYKITEKYEKFWGRWDNDLQLFHVVKEICELSDVLRNKKEKYGKFDSKEFKDTLLDELADVFLTSFASAGKLGITPEELNNAIVKKLHTINERVKELEKQAEHQEKTDNDN